MPRSTSISAVVQSCPERLIEKIYLRNYIRETSTFNYDVKKKEVTSECDRRPSGLKGSLSVMLMGQNNMYDTDDESDRNAEDSDKDEGRKKNSDCSNDSDASKDAVNEDCKGMLIEGYWLIPLISREADHVWFTLQKSIEASRLYKCCVHMVSDKPHFVARIFTRDIHNIADVIQTLKCLERIRLKERHETIYYFTRHESVDAVKENGGLLYSSETILSGNPKQFVRKSEFDEYKLLKFEQSDMLMMNPSKPYNRYHKPYDTDSKRDYLNWVRNTGLLKGDSASSTGSSIPVVSNWRDESKHEDTVATPSDERRAGINTRAGFNSNQRDGGKPRNDNRYLYNNQRMGCNQAAQRPGGNNRTQFKSDRVSRDAPLSWRSECASGNSTQAARTPFPSNSSTTRRQSKP